MSDMSHGETTRTERRRRHTHDVLLNAGFEIVGERGVSGWPISDVAERADVALGSFYNHFADREDFIDALIRTYSFAEQGKMLTLVPYDIGDFPKRFALRFCGLIDRALDMAQYRAFVVAVGQVNHRRPQELTDEFLRRLAIARDDGELMCENLPAVLAATQGLVLSMFAHIDHLESQEPGSTDRLSLQVETVRMILSIVGVAPVRIAEITAEILSGTLSHTARELRAMQSISLIC